jgi:hypothetical protein
MASAWRKAVPGERVQRLAIVVGPRLFRAGQELAGLDRAIGREPFAFAWNIAMFIRICNCCISICICICGLLPIMRAGVRLDAINSRSRAGPCRSH